MRRRLPTAIAGRPSRVPILAILPAENIRWHGEIEKIAGGGWRDCRDSGIAESADFANIGKYCPRLTGLHILPILQAENRSLHAEIEKTAGTTQIADIGKIVDHGKGAEIA